MRGASSEGATRWIGDQGRTATLVALAAALSACAGSDYQGYDAGPPPDVDLGPYTLSEVRRPYPVPCGEGRPCPVGTVCGDTGFCGNTFYERCSFDPNGDAHRVTSNGDPCGITSVADDGWATGIGVPASLCVALEDSESYEAIHYADVFTEGCRWTDGSTLVTPAEGPGCFGFPPVLWSHEWIVLWAFCGGPCGNAPCGPMPGETNAFLQLLGAYDPPCVGRSDERAFGVCAVTSARCSAERLYGLDDCDNWLSETLDGEQICACMFTGDADGSEPDAQGWVVPHSVCERYRDIYPASVTCRDGDFALIP